MMDAIAMREAYGRALVAYGETNTDVVVLDADTSGSTLTSYFAQRFPERFYNIGIAEPCMVDIAVGLALAGKIPFANAFAPLLALRALEQIRTCVCYARSNVKLAAAYAGVSDYKDGPTHHSLTDIAIMRALPRMTVLVPADAAEAARSVQLAAEFDGPLYLRLSRAATLPVHQGEPAMEIGKGIVVRQGADVSLIATGAMVGRSLAAAEALADEGISARVIDVHTIKPLDVALIEQAAEETGAVVTAEEHSIIGGLGGAVAEALAETWPAPVERVGVNDTFACTGPDPDSLMDAYGLAIEDIVAAAKRCIARKCA
ncbi:MAG: transketolase family protein [Anaerolineales bacterium]|nr:transketolase family protein [Anaerolineales bacterium]